MSFMSGPAHNTRLQTAKHVCISPPSTPAAPGSFDPQQESSSEEEEDMANTTSGPSRNVRESSTLSTTLVQPHDYSIKLGAPPKFTGTPDSLANLIFYCNMEFTVKPLTYEDDAKKVIFLISHLGSLTSRNGAAFTWARTMHKKKDECMEDFDLFVERLEEFYGSAEEYSAAEAEIKLEKLRQTKSCAEYAATFNQLTATLGFNDKAKTTLFKCGLKTQI